MAVDAVPRRPCSFGGAGGWRFLITYLKVSAEPEPYDKTNVLLLHAHGIEQNPEKLMRILLSKVKILVVFLTERGQEGPRLSLETKNT